MKFKVVIQFFWFLVFICFAAVQYNDPDPWLWGITYLAFAIISIWGVWKRVPMWVYFVAADLALVWAWFQWPEKWEGIGETMMNENTVRARESLGLIIGAFSMMVLLLVGYFGRKTTNPTMTD